MTSQAVLSLAALVVVAVACGGGSTSASTTTNGVLSTTGLSVTTTSPATTTTGPATSPAPSGSEVRPRSLAVPDDIRHRGGGDEIELTGPSLLAISAQGGVYFDDPESATLRFFRGDAAGALDLRALDVLGVTALAAADDHLLVVEVYFAPARQRVHRLGYDGEIVETIDLPEGLRLEDGLSGVFPGPGREIVIELEGGVAWGIWDGGPQWRLTRTLDVGPTRVTRQSPDIEIDGRRIIADLVGPIGGLRYLAATADAAVILVRDDVLETSPFRVLTTVEWYAADGGFLGSARVPSIDEQHTDNVPGLAATPEGRVFALTTSPTSVDLVELVRIEERIVDR